MRLRLLLTLAVVASLVPLAGARAATGDTTGISADTITIGLHAPATGAAPIPPNALSEGASLFWQYYENDLGQLVNGRHVQVEFEDDHYNPSQAVAVCDQMAQSSFLLLGFYGTDEIYSCAQYAQQHGIPYLSPGAQRQGLDQVSTYFALSPDWTTQAKLMADYVVNRLGSSADRYPPPGPLPTPTPSSSPMLRARIKRLIHRLPLPLPSGTPTSSPSPSPSPTQSGPSSVVVGLVRPNTPGYDQAAQALGDAFSAAGYTMYTYPVEKDGSEADAQSVTSNMRGAGVDVGIVMTDPVFTSFLVSDFESENYAPLLLGESISDGFDTLLEQGSCNPGSVLDGASFFSPWPAASDSNAFDPDFMRAVQEYAPDLDQDGNLDVAFALWGEMKDLRHLLVDAGPDLTRQSFIDMMNAGESISTGVYPDATFSSSQHFGATALHRLQASCADQRFHEGDAFVSDYPPQS